MPSSRKTFRVFVSSTFTDMRAERRILQEKVFPDLKKYCEARGASFQAVDLRWGVNEESQREQKTMEICLTEIARCQRLSPRPNFIVLLGDRYGWQPIPNKIPTDEMEQLQAYFSDQESSLIGKWYREDTNALPQEYVLLPRGEGYQDYDHWQPVEDSLRAILRNAVEQTCFSTEQRTKYFASATHQEIINGALQTPDIGIDPADHVFAYLREMDPLPQGDQAGDYLDLLPDGKIDPHAKAQMDALKQELSGKLPKGHIYKYQAQWREGAQFAEGVLEAFAAKVYRDLVSVIDQELQKITVTDDLTREKELQEDFRKRLTRFFTGQEEPRRQIAAYLEQGSGKPLVLLGPSGSGKSCLMAQAIKDAAAAFPGVIIYRFIGATAASSNPLLLLRQVCDEIAAAYGTDLQALLQVGEDDKKLGTYGGLSQLLPRCLALATKDKPLLIFLDALDQIQSHLFDFLPHTLPEYVRIIVSALPDLEEKLSFANLYQLPPMPDPDGETLLDKWLVTEGRTLTPGQRQEVMGKFGQNGLPLYLRLAFEKVRQWHSYDVDQVLPANVEGILADYFDFLEKAHTPALVSKVAGYLLSGKYQGLTEAEVLDLLVFDREYWEDFVQGSHPAHREEIKELGRFPFVVWSRLFLDLEPYLSERDADGLPIISFYHRKFREHVQERYLASPPGAEGAREVAFHDTLARYFETQPLCLDDKEQSPNVRKVVEQPHQETLAGRWEALTDTCLAHFPFLMAKAKAALVEGILEDYSLAFEKIPQAWREKLKFWEAFFRERAHILRRGNDEWPAYKILLQLAVEHADDSPVTLAAEEYLAAGKCNWPWLRRERRVKHVGLDPCLAIFEGHTDKVWEALVLPNWRILSWSDFDVDHFGEDHALRLWEKDGKLLVVLKGHTSWIKGVLALPDGRILSWSWDKTLRLWDQNGELLAILEYSALVEGALALPDGRILSWSQDKALRLWDREGKPIVVLEGHNKDVVGALALPDGRILSWSRDKTLRLWDWEGKPLAVLEGHSIGVEGALSLEDGRIFSWSFVPPTNPYWGSSLKHNECMLWDRNGKPLAVPNHMSNIKRVLALPDGRILSWSWDETLRIWDRNGKPLAILEGYIADDVGALMTPDGKILSWKHSILELWDRNGKSLAVFKDIAGINGVLALPDGRILSWSRDKTLRLWDRNGKSLAVFEGHIDSINGALVMPDRQILSWSNDKTLRLWDCDRKPLVILEGHGGGVNGILVMPNEQILSWSADRTLRLWDRGGEPLEVLEGHTAVINGALVLTDRLILSWSDDKTLRIWDRTGNALAILRGHTFGVIRAILLPAGQILSWSDDETLRLWDRDGKCLAILEGHTDKVCGALAMPDGRILSWSSDKTLRLWDQGGKPLAVLKGLNNHVDGVLVLSNGRILSWSEDNTLRLWDRNGKPLAVLEGHDLGIKGALEMPDGRILSWSWDETLRVWDRNGKPLTVLRIEEVFIGNIDGALALPDGRIISWSVADPYFVWRENALRIWDNDGKSLEIYKLDEGVRLYPEMWRKFYKSECVSGNSFLTQKGNFVLLAGGHREEAFWHGALGCTAHQIFPNGRAVVTQDNGQVCVLQLYHGNRPVTLDELETLATTEASNFPPTESTGNRT